jgi:hypothetical protein
MIRQEARGVGRAFRYLPVVCTAHERQFRVHPSYVSNVGNKEGDELSVYPAVHAEANAALCVQCLLQGDRLQMQKRIGDHVRP